MEPLNLIDVQKAVGGRLLASAKPDEPGPSILRVVIDSRQVKTGDLFVAFPGSKTDGHLFVQEAFRKGASACLVSRIENLDCGPLVQVNNVEHALVSLAAWYRGKINVPVVAITGSSGKSTTKEITAELLSRHMPVLAAHESYNNEIGVPLTLLSWEKAHQAVVLEMAMRGKGEIKQLCRIAFPEVGLVTSIGEAHVGLLGSIKEIADAKGELLESLPPKGLAFLNSEDSWTPYLAKKTRCQVRTYGFHSSDWVRAVDLKETWEGSSFTLVSPPGEIEVRFPLLGKHNLLNFLGSAAVALALGVPLPKIQEGASLVKTLHGRLQKKKGKNGMLILDDSYNANPASLAAAMKTVVSLPSKGGRALVMGDMLELGDFAEQAHRKIGEQAAALGFDAFFAVGDLTAGAVLEARKHGLKSARHFSNVEALMDALMKSLTPEAVVLIKGSRKMAMEDIAERLLEK